MNYDKEFDSILRMSCSMSLVLINPANTPNCPFHSLLILRLNFVRVNPQFEHITRYLNSHKHFFVHYIHVQEQV